MTEADRKALALYEALVGILRHACVADAAPDDVDEEDRERERAARRAIAAWDSRVPLIAASDELRTAPGYRAGLVAAAKVCEERAAMPSTDGQVGYGAKVAEALAARIRALIPPAAEEMAESQGAISSATVRRAVAVHLKHAGQNVGPLGSDADIRFFALALAGEAGELANVVKKSWRDDKPLNREAALEELAGTACYLVGMAVALDCDLDAEMNKQMTAFEARPKP